MDASLPTTQKSRLPACHGKLATALFALVLVFCSDNMLLAQIFDLRSRSGDQHLTHDLQSTVLEFAEVRWDVLNASQRDGAVVVLEADVFEMVSGRSRFLQDTGLFLTIINSSGRNNWQVVNGTARTRHASGQTSANVTASGRGNGHASLGVVVSMISSNPQQITAGDYQTRLVGTITAF